MSAVPSRTDHPTARRRPLAGRFAAASLAAATVAAAPAVTAQDAAVKDAAVVRISDGPLADGLLGEDLFAESAIAPASAIDPAPAAGHPLLRDAAVGPADFDLRESELVPFTDLDAVMNQGVRPASAGGLTFGETTRVGNGGTLGVSLGGSPLSGVGTTGLNYAGDDYTVLRQAQLGVTFSEREVVVNSGVTANLYEAAGFAAGARALFGGALIENIDDQFHFSGDLFAGTYSPLLSAFGDVWVKGGAFVDYQGKFGKVGPAVGVLVNPNSRFPLLFDAAFGFGLGGTRREANNDTIISTRAADEDIQLRAGTFLTPNVEAGFTFEHAYWDDRGVFDEEDDSYGAFTRVSLGQVTWQVEVTASEQEVNGFVNCVVQLDKPRQANLLAGRPLYGGQEWINRPVFRDPQIRFRQRTVDIPPPIVPPVETGPTAVGNITPINAVAVFPTRIPAGPGDLNGNGVIDAGETFEIDFGFANQTTNVATNVSFGFNATVVGPATQIGFVGGTLGDISPGTTFVTDSNQDACILVDAGAAPGSQIFLQYDVTADGQTQTFVSGPFIVGQITNGTTVQTVVSGTTIVSTGAETEVPVPRAN